jgi:hypothetical protein
MEMEVQWLHGKSSRPRQGANNGDKGVQKREMAAGKGTGRAGRQPVTNMEIDYRYLYNTKYSDKD